MSSDALSHFMAIVLEQVKALLRNTMSFGCFSVNFSDPYHERKRNIHRPGL